MCNGVRPRSTGYKTYLCQSRIVASVSGPCADWRSPGSVGPAQSPAHGSPCSGVLSPIQVLRLYSLRPGGGSAH